MKRKISSTWVFLGIAVVAGGLAFFLSKRYFDQQESRIRAELTGSKDEWVSIVVASRDLSPGEVISTSTMSMGSMPGAHASLRMIRPEQFKAVEGRVLGRPLRSGEPLMVDYVSGSFVERFSEILAIGERAVSLEVTELENHAGMLVPGDYVDLFVLMKVESQGKEGGDDEKQHRLLPVLERVKVLAAGPAALRSPDQDYSMLEEREAHYTALTVGVPVEDAERLLLARQMGDMAYLLRRPNDPAMNVAVPMDSSMVTGNAGHGRSASEYRYVSASVPGGKMTKVLALDLSAPLAMLSQPVTAATSVQGVASERASVRSATAALVDELYGSAAPPSEEIRPKTTAPIQDAP